MSAISSLASSSALLAAQSRAGSKSKPASGSAAKTGKTPGQLTPQQQSQVDELKKRDADVHKHEEAHLAAAGGFARGGAVYQYQAGPDGHQYAVGGHVDIDASAVPGDPRATIAKLRTVQAAALAPADPSGEDRAVAAQAAAGQAKAQAEVSQENSAGVTASKSQSKKQGPLRTNRPAKRRGNSSTRSRKLRADAPVESHDKSQGSAPARRTASHG